MRRLILGLAALVIAAACSSTSAPNSPPPVPTAQLHFVVQDTAAPPLRDTVAEFVAKVGENREVRLFYQGAAPGDSGDEFLRFEVPNDGLYRRPDGSSFGVNDSITVTITIVDRKKFLFAFAPSGLQFNPNDPARLKIEYMHSDHDYDGDGQITGADSTIERQLDVWKNDPPSTWWAKAGAVNFESLNELDAKVYSFSQYAVAW